MTVLAFCFLIGCSNSPKTQDKDNPPLLGANSPDPTLSATDLNDNETDMQRLPAELNEKVTEWVEYFQGRGRDHMTVYLSRSSRYLPYMKEVLKSHGLPEDLVYIALIESGFSHKAYSRARAVGYWQFIRGTGKRYGLQQNYYIDERRDFIKSTDAAAMYLKALYNLFGSWYLAIASYNVGENRIKNLVMTYYTRDFWELARQNRLPKETTNYVPKFLAARLIAKHPQKYGFDKVPWQAPLDFKEVVVNNQGVDLKQMAKSLNMPYDELAALNPSYLRGIVPKSKPEITLRVPSHFVDDRVQLALKSSGSNISSDTIADGDGDVYRIRRGDTLSHIAARFNTTIPALQEANNLGRRDMLYPGKKIVIPGKRSVSTGTSAKSTATVALSPGEKTYVVRQGDNLYNIAKKFGVSLAKIKERNSLSSRTLLNIGKVLVIPASSDGAS
jgi:membrane-bound lytic murein transglycosylase D